jgi:hypothetical protein
VRCGASSQWIQNTTSFKDSFGSFKPIGGPAFLIGDQMPAHAPFGIFLVAKFNIAGGFWRELGDIAAVMCFPGFAVGDNHRLLVAFLQNVFKNFGLTSRWW